MPGTRLQCPWPACSFKTPCLDGAVGIQLLQLHHQSVHTTASSPPVQHRPPKAKLPHLEVSEDGTVTETAMGIFKQQLASYTRLSGATTDDPDIVLQSLPPVAYSLMFARHGSGLTTQTAEQLIIHIEALLVRPENKLAHVVKLQKMSQEHGQTVAQFSAGIRAAARRCQFQIPCDCTKLVSYEEHMVLYQLLSGLGDQDVQADLLARTDLTLREAEQYAMDREMAKRSQLTVQGNGEVNRIRTTHNTQEPIKTTSTPATTAAAPCRHCGERAHRNRRLECSAFNHLCTCGRRGHLPKVCFRKGKPRNVPPGKQEAISDDGVYEMSTRYAIDPASGHIGGISRARGNRLPVTVRVDTPNVPRLSSRRGSPVEHTTSCTAVADTGATVTCGGPDVLAALGVQQTDLLPTNIRLFAANKSRLRVLGVLPITVSLTSDGHDQQIPEMLYVVHDLSGMYLSKDMLASLGSIPPSFPYPPASRPADTSSADVRSVVASKEDSSGSPKLAPCGCPMRANAPDPPLIPEGATEADIPRLKELLLNHYASSTFNTCSHQPLPLMHGPPLEFALKPDAVPRAVYTPAVVPCHWEEKIRRDLDRDVEMGVLEKVGVNDPVTWCSRMVVTRKHNGEPRRTIDLQVLNEASLRQTHPTMPPFQKAMSIPPGHWKSTTDAFNGYHSVAIRESDRHLTTFLTPWGRYRYRTTPQGYKASGDAYTHRFDRITVDVRDCDRVIDDSILHKPTVGEMFRHVAEYLTLCGQNGIIQNPDKFTFCERTVNWAGFQLGPDGVRPLPAHTDAIRSFPTPRNITDIRSFMALVNQVSVFYATQPSLLPFRDLLKKDTPFYWDESLDRLFAETKVHIATEVEKGIMSFSLTKPTCLLTDWSKTGLGYLMLQKHCSCLEHRPTCCPAGWKVCGVGSRFTSPAESRYSPSEGEALAVVNALEKTKYFTLGCNNLTIGTDHKPLLGLLKDRSLDGIDNPRLRRLKEKTFGWSFTMLHIPGRLHGGPDALSRYGLQPDPTGVQADDDGPERHHLTALMAVPPGPDDAADTELLMSVSSSLQPIDLSTVTVASQEDSTIRAVVHMLSTKFPDSPEELDPAVREYWRIRRDLSTSGHVLLYRGRLVIPTSLRTRVLSALHAAHQGVTGMRLRAERSFFWPRMSQDIESTRERCMSCNRHAPSQSDLPPIPPIIPEYPFQHIAADFFSYKGNSYGVVVDRFSNWFQIWEGHNLTLMKVLTNLCRDFGVPETITTDGGAQFVSGPFQDFLRQHNISHRLTSVAFPHANCRAEVAVKTAKRLIQDNVQGDGRLDSIRLTRALLQYRNTPDRASGMSPAELLLGRQLRDFLPGTALAPPLRTFSDLRRTWQDVAKWRENALCRRATADHERLQAHTSELPPLRAGQTVLVQNQTGNRPRQWDRRGVIVEVMPFRQYKVMLDGSRQLTLRNRKFLRAFTPVSPASPLPSGVGVSHQTSPRTDAYTETRAVSDNSAPLDHPTLLSSSQTATVRPAPRRSARLAGKASRSKL